jgi:hypothetical protein
MVDRVEGEMYQEYLEDGVYASFDGFQIWLRVDRDGREQSVALEPVTMAKLNSYAARVFARPSPPEEDLTARLARLKNFEP